MKCTSRPDCPCDFCIGLRAKHASGLSEKEEQDMIAFCWMRDREMDAEMDTNWCLADKGRFLNRVTGEVIVWEVDKG
jgi:hypothetical protein